MSDHHELDPNGTDGDDALLDLLAAALTEDGELLPTDEAEVARAEAQGVEDVALPASLEQLRERSSDGAGASARRDEADQDAGVEDGAVDTGGAEAIDLAAYRERKKGKTQPPARRLSWATHSAAGLLGAAAAALLLFSLKPESSPTVPTSEPAGLSSSAPTAERLRVTLPPVACGDGCCAGKSCSKAKGDLASCSSGRDCIPCSLKELAKSHYRVRTGAVFTTELGNDTIELYPKGELELCVRAGAGPETCLPSYLNDRKTPYLSRLPVLVSKEDMGTVLQMRLRWKGVSGPLATPARVTTPIMVTPKSLCRGHRVNFRTEKEEIFANMSLFLADTHYVELKRAAGPKELRAYHRSIEWSGVEAQLQETRSTAAERFVLTIGPLDQPAAERIRWQLLEQDQAAVTSVGSDYVGDPQVLE